MPVLGRTRTLLLQIRVQAPGERLLFTISIRQIAPQQRFFAPRFPTLFPTAIANAPRTMSGVHGSDASRVTAQGCDFIVFLPRVRSSSRMCCAARRSRASHPGMLSDGWTAGPRAGARPGGGAGAQVRQDLLITDACVMKATIRVMLTAAAFAGRKFLRLKL